ncbi:hypothetical protein TNCV_2079161 [Trichonephila clavipes]|nr:hypothetical protein TNCV_2079161 [Trichonephila clavipes]
MSRTLLLSRYLKVNFDKDEEKKAKKYSRIFRWLMIWDWESSSFSSSLISCVVAIIIPHDGVIGKKMRLYEQLMHFKPGEWDYNSGVNLVT